MVSIPPAIKINFYDSGYLTTTDWLTCVCELGCDYEWQSFEMKMSLSFSFSISRHPPLSLCDVLKGNVFMENWVAVMTHEILFSTTTRTISTLPLFISLVSRMTLIICSASVSLLVLVTESFPSFSCESSSASTLFVSISFTRYHDQVYMLFLWLCVCTCLRSEGEERREKREDCQRWRGCHSLFRSCSSTILSQTGRDGWRGRKTGMREWETIAFPSLTKR